MSNYTTAARRALVLSVLSAVFVALQTALDAVDYAKVGAFGNGLYYVLATGVLALVLPACAYSGIRRSKPRLLAVFAGGSYCAGISDCFFVCYLVAVASVLFSMRNIVDECRSEGPTETCPDELAAKLETLCAIFLEPAHVKGHGKVAEAEALLPANSTLRDEDIVAHCLNVLESLGSVGLRFIVVSIMLRCVAVCFHCGAGVFGVELHTMLKDVHYSEADPETSDDSSSDEESSSAWE
mmetsp:Transcript_82967/g.232523  ORF Transcript_82967/g.232523 Transcript_82967/m.232523 type:complete len:239 (+) Transcript_82967:96-812(+)